jgi:cardiolipin synthase
MRFNRSGAIVAVVWLLVGAAWTWSVASPWWLAWFAVVALFGAFVPGAANQVSLARAYLAGPALLYSLRSDFGALAVVVAVAGLTDLVDGTVARRLSGPSQLGGALDPVVDGVFMGALTVGLGVGGIIPLWLALIVVARYLLPALGGGLLIALGRRPDLRHTLTGQVSTTLILVLIGGVCLFRGLNQDAGALLTSAEIVIPIATVATYVHLGFAALTRPAAATSAG